MGAAEMLTRIGLLLAVSTTVGLYFASQSAFNPALIGPLNWRKALAINLTYYYCWGLAVPAIIALAKRFSFVETEWRRALAAHVVASVLFTGAITVLAEAILKFLLKERTDSLAIVVKYAIGVNFHSTLPTYWMVLAVYLALDFYVRMRDREFQALQLQSRLSEARLEALRSQLQPHFLFNTLNSISSLIHKDTHAAEAMVSRLAAFLRTTIDSDSRQLVPLREELDFVQRYLEIEQVRFADRLVVEYEIDADVLEALVPALILQPLVENAVHHSIAPRELGGRIVIGARTQSSCLLLSVSDDGPGLRPAPLGERRVGLPNTRARLDQLFGDRFSLTLDPGSGQGVSISIVIPRQFSSAVA